MKRKPLNLMGVACLLSFSVLFSACSKDEMESATPLGNDQATLAKKGDAATMLYALTDKNQLVTYSVDGKVRETGSVMVQGLQNGEMLLAIDIRPATGQLYGVSNLSRLFVIDRNTGQATPVGSQPFSPAIDGTQVGFDFNPTVDRIRLVTDKSQNLRLHPVTGAVAAIDGSLNPGNPSVVAVAYTNSMAGATSTTLYDIDVNTNMLYIQMPPNAGGLVAVGPLHVQASGEGGFDIAPDNSLAIAVLYGRGGGAPHQVEETNGNKYRFYSIDLKTGKAVNLGKTDRSIIGVALDSNK